MAYNTSNMSGVDYTQVFTPPAVGDRNYGEEAAFTLGQISTGSDGSEWVYVQLGTGGLTGSGYVCVMDEAFGAVMLSTSNDVFGYHVGVPVGTGVAVEDDYVWLQIAGVCPTIRVAALCAENALLSTTATAGELDDAAGLVVDGIILTTTAVGAGTQPGILNYPTVTATAGA